MYANIVTKLSRFDKIKRNFSAFLYFIAALQWLKENFSTETS